MHISHPQTLTFRTLEGLLSRECISEVQYFSLCDLVRTNNLLPFVDTRLAQRQHTCLAVSHLLWVQMSRPQWRRYKER